MKKSDIPNGCVSMEDFRRRRPSPGVIDGSDMKIMTAAERYEARRSRLTREMFNAMVDGLAEEIAAKSTPRIMLPGAERFTQYLLRNLKGRLTAEGPEIVDRSYNGEYAKKWAVKLNGKQIGDYFTFGPKPGETEFGREFKGVIPGYSGELSDRIGLVFSNKGYEVNYLVGSAFPVETPWQRQDGHEKIPFP